MQKIKVSFDNQIFITQKFGGISRYFVELFKQFDKSEDIKWQLLGVFSRNEYLNTHFSRLKKISISTSKYTPINRFFSIINKLFYIIFATKSRTDLYHLTYYDLIYFKKLDKKTPKVVTIYDMIHEKFGGDAQTINAKKYLANHADLILTISNSTAADLQEIYNIPSSKIAIVYLASSLQPVKNGFVSSEILPLKYILFVGLRDWYKNFDGFIEAISPLLLADNELFVLCAGGPPFNQMELDLLISKNISQQVLWKKIESDEQQSWYYQNALFFIFPSKYEGFGIPILEAMNCDCPVVLSNTSSLIEIADYAGHYFDPNLPKSIRSACQELLFDKELRNQLIAKGQKRRGDFSWENTGRQTLEAYKKLLNV